MNEPSKGMPLRVVLLDADGEELGVFDCRVPHTAWLPPEDVETLRQVIVHMTIDPSSVSASPCVVCLDNIRVILARLEGSDNPKGR